MSSIDVFDAKKAVEVLLYVMQKTTNLYNIVKVLYYADLEHLSRYGRSVCGDGYFAMDYGPVPSKAYDILKDVRDRRSPAVEPSASDAFAAKGQHRFVPRRQPDLDYLSDSDIECLDAAIKKCGRLTFDELCSLSHTDKAYQAVGGKGVIPLKVVVLESLPNGASVWAYLQGN